MLLETDWLNILVDMGDNKFKSLNLAKYDFALFFDGDANMINSRERKRMQPSTGMRATSLSLGRKR